MKYHTAISTMLAIGLVCFGATQNCASPHGAADFDLFNRGSDGGGNCCELCNWMQASQI
jgi:hypothetical protein